MRLPKRALLGMTTMGILAACGVVGTPGPATAPGRDDTAKRFKVLSTEVVCTPGSCSRSTGLVLHSVYNGPFTWDVVDNGASDGGVVSIAIFPLPGFSGGNYIGTMPNVTISGNQVTISGIIALPGNVEPHTFFFTTTTPGGPTTLVVDSTPLTPNLTSGVVFQGPCDFPFLVD